MFYEELQMARMRQETLTTACVPSSTVEGRDRQRRRDRGRKTSTGN